jgi:DNA-binding MarR family transcriptional regulator
MQRVQEVGHNLTPVQFAALDALRHRPGIDQARLADMIAKDRATAGAVVDRLRQKGLIERAVNRRDKRSRELTLTSDGEAILAAVTPVVVRLQREILPGLDDSEYRQFIDLAAKAVKPTRLRGAS